MTTFHARSLEPLPLLGLPIIRHPIVSEMAVRYFIMFHSIPSCFLPPAGHCTWGFYFHHYWSRAGATVQYVEPRPRAK